MEDNAQIAQAGKHEGRMATGHDRHVLVEDRDPKSPLTSGGSEMTSVSASVPGEHGGSRRRARESVFQRMRDASAGRLSHCEESITTKV